LDIFLPFILIFVIVFAVLQRTHILGKGADKKKFNVVLALVMGLSVVIPHALGRYPPESDPVLLINNVLPNISLIMLAVIAFMLIIGVFGHSIKLGEKGTLSGLVMIIAAFAVLCTFGVAANWFGQLPWWLSFLEDPSTQTLFIVILVTGIILAIITKGGGDDKGPEDSNFAKLFKGSLDKVGD
jgi:uncharacterized membrane protein YozB (DUF420 family)